MQQTTPMTVIRPKQRKIAIMGYRAVGKSSLSVQYVENEWIDTYDPTIENTFEKNTTVLDQEFELKLVDTAGQDEYSILPSQYSMDVHGYVLVYSVTSPKSFEIIQVIYEKLLDITGKRRVPVVLVGNKKDLHEDRAVSEEEGRKLAQSWNAVFLEASAKENEVSSQKCIADIFTSVIIEIEKANGNIPENKSSCTIS